MNACDIIDNAAQRMGAVNTINFDNGKIIGSNSDGPGLVRAIREFSIDIRDLRVMILGAGGGAGRAAAIQCAMEKVEGLVLVNRTKEKAKENCYTEIESDFLDDNIRKDSSRLKICEWTDDGLKDEISNIDLIINANPIGMNSSDPDLIPQGF